MQVEYLFVLASHPRVEALKQWLSHCGEQVSEVRGRELHPQTSESKAGLFLAALIVRDS